MRIKVLTLPATMLSRLSHFIQFTQIYHKHSNYFIHKLKHQKVVIKYHDYNTAVMEKVEMRRHTITSF